MISDFLRTEIVLCEIWRILATTSSQQ